MNPVLENEAIRSVVQPAEWRLRVLAGSLGVMGLLAAVCGVLLILTDGLGMERGDLHNSPFSSFVVPGLFLSIAVGGSQLGAAIALLKQRSPASALALAASAVLLGWIIIEALMVPSGRGLQVFIFAYALLQLALAMPRRMRVRW